MGGGGEVGTGTISIERVFMCFNEWLIVPAVMGEGSRDRYYIH